LANKGMMSSMGKPAHPAAPQALWANSDQTQTITMEGSANAATDARAPIPDAAPPVLAPDHQIKTTERARRNQNHVASFGRGQMLGSGN
jgi:hypothetical protein